MISERLEDDRLEVQGKARHDFLGSRKLPFDDPRQGSLSPAAEGARASRSDIQHRAHGIHVCPTIATGTSHLPGWDVGELASDVSGPGARVELVSSLGYSEIRDLHLTADGKQNVLG